MPTDGGQAFITKIVCPRAKRTYFGPQEYIKGYQIYNQHKESYQIIVFAVENSKYCLTFEGKLSKNTTLQLLLKDESLNNIYFAFKS